MKYNVERFNVFADSYRRGLAKAMKDNPGEYLPGLDADEIATKMLNKIAEKGIGAVTIAQSKGFANACKELGIKQTYKEIGKYLNG